MHPKTRQQKGKKLQEKRAHDSRSPSNGNQPSQNQARDLSKRLNKHGGPKDTIGPNEGLPSEPSSGNQVSDAYKSKIATRPESFDSNCLNLEEFAKKAQELKQEIKVALDKQVNHHSSNDQPAEVVLLKNNLLELSGHASVSHDSNNNDDSQQKIEVLNADQSDTPEKDDMDQNVTGTIDEHASKSSVEKAKTPDETGNVQENLEPKSDMNFSQISDSGEIEKKSVLGVNSIQDRVPRNQSTQTDGRISSVREGRGARGKNAIINEGFEPLNSTLDPDSKYVALVASLQKHFVTMPHLLDPICNELVSMSQQIDELKIDCGIYRSENEKLVSVKQKLENLCRQLQKSRIESLDLIKLERDKAKDQADKIQSTLSGVVKLFDENHQKNIALRQENHDLLNKLKSLLEHCDNWEKSTETVFRQQDIENRLMKTELAKANLLRNEEKEKSLIEKQELLQIISMMQEGKHRIEGQEAKLRSDLSSYASKYDECQAVISRGMSKFQTESRKMLRQIEKSKEDYKLLQSKFEASNKKMANLLEERQTWDTSLTVANRKIEALEKLCRALRDSQKPTDIRPSE